jgi:putative oxidoreductase
MAGGRPETVVTAVKRVLATNASWPLLLARVALAVAIFPHGVQKLLGGFGGYGFAGTMGYFTDALGIPFALGVLAIVAEFFGPIALLTGLLSRVAAAGIGVVMLVATLTVHLPNGFFMNWSGQQAGEGFEYHILAIGLAAAVAIGGSGRLSIDRLLARRLTSING